MQDYKEAIDTTESSARDLAREIEELTQDMQIKLSDGLDINFNCSELVKKVSTLVFLAGEIYSLRQLQQQSFTTVKSAKVVKPGPNYRHNLRGTGGRFISARGSTFVTKTNLTSVLLNPVNGQV